ncbi:unnamed protein product [Prunus armeniaca]
MRDANADVSQLGLQPGQDLPLGFLGLVGPATKLGYGPCAGANSGCVGQPFPLASGCVGDALSLRQGQARAATIHGNALGLKPRQNLPLGLPGLVGPRACPGCKLCAGAALGLPGGPFAQFDSSAGAALRIRGNRIKFKRASLESLEGDLTQTKINSRAPRAASSLISKSSVFQIYPHHQISLNASLGFHPCNPESFLQTVPTKTQLRL